MNPFPTLDNPPLDEVVCGFLFGSVVELNALRLGIYWNDRRADFPTTSIHPPVMEAPHVITLGQLPQRVWMEAKDGSIVLQMQHDRFYVNWRARGAIYPRFSSRDGNDGLLAIALREFRAFSEFVETETGAALSVSGCEVAKIDALQEGKHWQGVGDLFALAPVLSAFGTLGPAEEIADFDHRVQLVGPPTQSIRLWSQFRQTPRAVRLETRVTGKVRHGEEPEATFRALNEAANQAFFSVLGQGEARRFITRQEESECE